MKTAELLEVERALRSIGRTLEARYHDHDRDLASAPSSAADLPTDTRAPANPDVTGRHSAMQERAAIHYCLTSAAVLLDATRQLMAQPAPRAPKDREERLRSLIDDMKVAAHSAYRAGFSLAGHDPRRA